MHFAVLAGEILQGALEAMRDVTQAGEDAVHLFRAGAHAGGEDTEIGELLLAAAGEHFHAIVLHLQLREQCAGTLFEAVCHAFHGVCQSDWSGGSVGRQQHAGFGEGVIHFGLEEAGGIGDGVFLLFAATVCVKGEQDDDADQDRIQEGDVG